jgi:hypothetical protein
MSSSKWFACNGEKEMLDWFIAFLLACILLASLLALVKLGFWVLWIP